jgi:hypothetical protein
VPGTRAWADLARVCLAAKKLPHALAAAACADAAPARVAVLEACEEVLGVLVGARDMEGAHAACKLIWNTGGAAALCCLLPVACCLLPVAWLLWRRLLLGHSGCGATWGVECVRHELACA